MASDFCLAADDARFWEPFMSRGFTPDSGAAWLLPRLIGMVRTRKLLMLGQEISGATAAEWGIIHSAHPDDQLGSAAEVLIADLSESPTVALGLTKWLLQSGNGLDLDRHLQNEAMALELSSRSEDFREGLAAFRDKRDARFQGR
jgi:2-(1,2-epoxy-1,2-dihydrophenyl)acetyl-CoA isomerase